MRTTEEKKEILQKVVDFLKQGYPVTGKGSAAELAGVNYVTIYNYLRDLPEMQVEYQKAKKILQASRKASDKRMGVAQKRDYLEKIIAYIADGCSVRGRHSAVLLAAKDLNLPIVHWQTVFVWLRRDFKDLYDTYRAAKEARKNYKLREKAACGKITS